MKGLTGPILDGSTALHKAIWNFAGTLHIEDLLRWGANVRIRDHNGRSPRDLANALSESGKTLFSFPGEKNYMVMQMTNCLEVRNLLQQVERGYDVCESVLIVIYFTLRKHRGFYKDVA